MPARAVRTVVEGNKGVALDLRNGLIQAGVGRSRSCQHRSESLKEGQGPQRA